MLLFAYIKFKEEIMTKKQKYEDLAKNIVDLIGGMDNITFFTHCITRLRINVKDKGLVKNEAILALSGVVGSQWAGEQYQIVIGQDVGRAYDEICEMNDLNTEIQGIFQEDEKQKILKHYDPDVLPIELVRSIYEEMEGLDPLSKMSNVDIQIWLEGDIYLNVDKMSRAAGLEVRMPLTDTRIFSIASRMPSRYKVNEEQNKVAFRTAAAKVLPEEIAFRKKLGFIVPIRIWMADERYNQDVRDKFHSEMAAKFFNLDEINAIFEDYIGGNSDNWRKVWTIYTFLVWYEEYFVKR